LALAEKDCKRGADFFKQILKRDQAEITRGKVLCIRFFEAEKREKGPRISPPFRAFDTFSRPIELKPISASACEPYLSLSSLPASGSLSSMVAFSLKVLT
jgi:hypothetical protein